MSGFMNLIKKWFISARPFSFPASVMPVIFGTALAVMFGGAGFRPLLFAAALLGMVLLHAGSNLLSDVYDYRKGMDRVVTPVCGGVPRGLITLRQSAVAGIICFSAGALLGLFLAWKSGWRLVPLGIIGIIIGVFYSFGGAFALKYHAFGDLAVFLNFGVFATLGSWFVQTGSFSLFPALMAVPSGLLIIGIVHANNWRDISEDSDAGISTMAMLLGDRGSFCYYTFLILAPFAFIVVLILMPFISHSFSMFLPSSFAVVLLVLPQARKLITTASSRLTGDGSAAFITLDGATAKFNIIFGLACTGALFLDRFLGAVFR